VRATRPVYLVVPGSRLKIVKLLDVELSWAYSFVSTRLSSDIQCEKKEDKDGPLQLINYVFTLSDISSGVFSSSRHARAIQGTRQVTHCTS
jgi:hypothetical protein